VDEEEGEAELEWEIRIKSRLTVARTEMERFVGEKNIVALMVRGGEIETKMLKVRWRWRGEAVVSDKN
jgi:hypothetical protein